MTQISRQINHFIDSWVSFYPHSKDKRLHYSRVLSRIKKLFGISSAREFSRVSKRLKCYPYKQMMNWDKSVKLYILKDSGKSVTQKAVNILRGCDFIIHKFDWADAKSLQMIGYVGGIIHFVQPVPFVSSKTGLIDYVDELTEIPLASFLTGQYPNGIKIDRELVEETIGLIDEL